MRTPAPFSLDSVVVGTSARMRALFDFLRVIAPGDSTVLITGESGTGKEVVAQVIHHWSPRRHRPFVVVSCALFSESLIEAELFGHERGAFTGAIKDRPGRFELAQGGTIFLDDVDDVPLAMQVKLLRVLQNRTVERVGGTRPIPVDVRVLAGAKRDLAHLVAEGKFREDLYYRLNVIPIVLPPLRERREDIPLLVDHFVRRFCRRRGIDPIPVSPAVMRAFLRYPWPGNVRELENACERLVETCTCRSARLGCVPSRVLFHPDQQRSDVPIAVPDDPVPLSLDDRLRELETSLIGWALRMTGGNKSRAAELLRVKRSTLGDRIARCGLDDAVSEPVAASSAA